MTTTKTQHIYRQSGWQVWILLLAFFLLSIHLWGQVTVGEISRPQGFSALELISNGEGGLRMPHLTTDQRDDLTKSAEFDNLKTTLAKGLTIYNIDTDCLEFWNGYEWISLCKDRIPGSGRVTVTACSESGATNRVSDNTGYYMYNYQTLKLFANSSDTPTSYQWLVDDIPVAGATGASYSYTPPAGIALEKDDLDNYKRKVRVTCRMVVGGKEVQPVNDFEILVIKADKDKLSPVYVSTLKAGGQTGKVAFAHVNLGSEGELDPCACLGDLYQWGRRNDGHEKRDSEVTDILAQNPEATLPAGITGKFIASGSAADWLYGGGQIALRWGDGTMTEDMFKGFNDPCPAGWKIPGSQLWVSIYYTSNGSETATANSWKWTGNGFMVSDALFLPAGGWRSNTQGAPISGEGTHLYYWSDTAEVGDYSYGLMATQTVPSLNVGMEYRSRGLSVRCIKE